MKNIFITGISRGIGFACAEHLSKNNIIFGSTRDKNKFINNPKNSFINPENVFEIDFLKQNDIENLDKILYNIKQDIQVLINNAGVVIFTPFEKSIIDDLKTQIEVNVYGAYHLTKLLLPSMIEKRQGMIINLISIAAEKPFENSSLYGASKAALSTMFASVREETRRQKVKITNLILGATYSDVWDEETRAKLGSRMIQPKSVAMIVDNIIDHYENDDFMIEEIVIRPQFGDL
ncbi:MAG TPA: SDR family NAD(P)-dependent oxidoreductase [Candidatus Kapabacteria bacterium]|jgi:short-subunit dehydrogenase|nr:SDR family NAD(P)-dependent oxidoreductase [Candidatus Kapabacteria bacterium]HOV93019.1 SDR family NAD(P)-dependent oxidoreductase [Candidatus Kapabacteria bacterium]